MALEQSFKDKVQRTLKEWTSGKGKEPPKRQFDPLRFERESDTEFNPADLHQHIKGEATRRKDLYAPVYRTWELILGYLWMTGWLKYDRVHKRHRELTKAGTGRAYSNPHLFDAVRRSVGLMVTNPPKIGFLPPGADPEALEACRGANVLLPHLDRVNRTRAQETVHAQETASIGTTLLEVFLDKTSQRIFTGKGEKTVKVASHRWIDPWNCLPNPGAKNFSIEGGCRNVILRDILHVEEIHSRFGVWVEPNTTLAEERRPGPFDDMSDVSNTYPLLVEDSAELFTTYIWGCGEAEKGRKIITCEDKVFEYEPGLLEKGRPNLVMWRYWTSADHFFGVPYPRQAIPALREINCIMTRMLTSALKKMGEWWGIHSASAVNLKQFFSRMTRRSFTYSGELPKNLAKEIDAEIEKYAPLLDRLFRDVDNALAYHEISRSGSDEYLKTATHADIAEENDIKALGVTFDERELAYMELAELRMQVQQQHGDDEMPFATFGKAMPSDMHAWKRTEFNNYLNAVAYGDSGKPRTSAAKLRSLQEVIKMGVLTEDMMRDMSVKENLLGFFEGLSVDTLLERLRRERSRAQNENLLLKGGKEVPVEVRQLHRVHIETHEALLDNPKAREEMSEDAVLGCHAHIGAHFLTEVNVRHADRQGMIPIEALQPGQKLTYPYGVASLMQDELFSMAVGYVKKFGLVRREDYETDEEYETAVQEAAKERLFGPAPSAAVAEEEAQLEEAREELMQTSV